jgi:hypothetical protein
MNIVVLLCDGIFGQKPVYIDGGAKIYEKNLYFVCNPSDLHAIALAMSIKKMIGDTLVTAISIGNARAADLVRKAMSIGAWDLGRLYCRSIGEQLRHRIRIGEHHRTVLPSIRHGVDGKQLAGL